MKRNGRKSQSWGGQTGILSRYTASWIILVFIAAWLPLLLCLTGCKNPFRTRKSPPPVTQTEGTWDTPFEPKVVMDNLLHSYNEKIIANFDRCLCDSFGFSAPEDSIRAVQDNQEELFANWDRDAEVSVTANIFTTVREHADSISYVLLLDPVPPVADDISDTAAVLLRDYELLVFESKPASEETTLARGTATFHMQQASLGWWCICFWSDIPEAAGGYDWGDFKARFR